MRGDQRITGMTSGQSRLPVAPSIFKFKKYDNDQDGLWVSDLYPHTAICAKDLCVVHAVFTEQINHEPGAASLAKIRGDHVHSRAKSPPSALNFPVSLPPPLHPCATAGGFSDLRAFAPLARENDKK